jgi:hypothetical protein
MEELNYCLFSKKWGLPLHLKGTLRKIRTILEKKAQESGYEQ